MSNVIKGEDVLLQFTNASNVVVALAAGRDATLQLDKDLLDTTSKTSGYWKEYIPGKRGATLNINALTVINSDKLNTFDLYNFYNSQNLVAWQFILDDGFFHIVFSGNAIITSLPIKRTVGELSTYDVSMTVTGVISIENRGSDLSYFWQISSTPKTAADFASDINSGVAIEVSKSSIKPINIVWDAAAPSYLMFAFPDANPAKVAWSVNQFNQGQIGGVTNLFGDAVVQSVTVPGGTVANNYKMYFSNWATISINDLMTLL